MQTYLDPSVEDFALEIEDLREELADLGTKLEPLAVESITFLVVSEGLPTTLEDLLRNIGGCESDPKLILS